MNVNITKRAAERVKKLFQRHGGGNPCLRIIAGESSCCSCNWRIDAAGSQRPNDEVFLSNDITIVCDRGDTTNVNAIEIDYSDDLLAGGFQIKCSAQGDSCGCGASSAN